jgi:hypothetical protein
VIERARAIWGKLRDAFSVERQMTDEARAGWEEWLAETDPQRDGFYDDVRGRGER